MGPLNMKMNYGKNLAPSFASQGTALITGLALLVVGASHGAVEAALDFEGQYTKHEFRIPMRDGVKLFTVVYTPKDKATRYPILIQRTPYDLKPYTIDSGKRPGGLPDSYVKERFIFAMQDVRGRFASEGRFEDMRPFRADKAGPMETDESTDAWDTIEWLVKHVPGHNGNVGLQGISYLGFYAAAGMINSHPALKAVSPQAPASDVYGGDDCLHGGGFWLAHNFSFWNGFDQGLEEPTRQEPRSFDFRTPDGYDFYLQGGSVARLGDRYYRGKSHSWSNMIANITNAAWCAERDLTPHLKHVKAAVLTIGGWFDAEDLHGTLKTYQATRANNPDIFNGLVMGPWAHGAWHRGEGRSLGALDFHAATAEHFRDRIELPFFRKFLKDATNETLVPVHVFQTGTDEWREFASWPPSNTVNRTVWLQNDQVLSFSPPDLGDSAFDEYTSDPNRPVPFTSRITTGMPREYMVEDQRFAARRPDVLVYRTAPLEEDLTVAGPMAIDLHVATTGTDGDWIVKVIDVYTGDHPDPEGASSDAPRLGHYQQLVRGEPLRAKFRNGLENPEPMLPGQIYRLQWTLPDVYHTFRTGHRLMVQIQSTWFPLLDRNPQVFCDVYRALPEDYKIATQRIYRDRAHASSLSIPVLPAQ
jgi:putative CocE/NonD family hydrolase